MIENGQYWTSGFHAYLPPVQGQKHRYKGNFLPRTVSGNPRQFDWTPGMQ